MTEYYIISLLLEITKKHNIQIYSDTKNKKIKKSALNVILYVNIKILLHLYILIFNYRYTYIDNNMYYINHGL